MSEAFTQILPDLTRYRSEFLRSGVALPLPQVPTTSAGLLGELPPPPTGKQGWPWTVQTPLEPTRDSLPAITIVMPSYQQGAYIEEALRSILLQNYPRLQLIVMDAGSTDGTTAILEKYKPWLSYCRSAPDRGQAHAINLGLSLADGDLRAWLNSDDMYLPGTFMRVAAAWQAGHPDFIFGDEIYLHQNTNRLQLKPAKLVLDRYVKFPGLVASHTAFWSSKRGKPLWEDQHCALDYELWIRLLPGARKRYIPWPLGIWRNHEGAKTMSGHMRQQWAEDAERNRKAHPALYRSRPWLEFEHRCLQSLIRRWRIRRMPRTLAAVRAECAWTEASPPARKNGNHP